MCGKCDLRFICSLVFKWTDKVRLKEPLIWPSFYGTRDQIGFADFALRYGLGLFAGHSLSGVPAVFIGSSGDVGIGTTIPQTALTISTVSAAENSPLSKVAVYADSASVYGMGPGYYSGSYGVERLSGEGLSGAPTLFAKSAGSTGIGATLPE